MKPKQRDGGCAATFDKSHASEGEAPLPGTGTTGSFPGWHSTPAWRFTTLSQGLVKPRSLRVSPLLKQIQGELVL
jgi:hypothetical protein